MNPPVCTGWKIVEDLEEECREDMLYCSIELSKIMVYVQQVEKKEEEAY